MGYDVSDYKEVDRIFGTPRGFRRPDQARPCARPQGHHRPGAEPHLRPASLVPRKPAEPHQFARRLVRLGRSQEGRLAAQQLAVGVRRPRLGMEPQPRASTTSTISSTEQPDLNFHNPDGAGRGARRHALLARARRRRLPPRHRQLLSSTTSSCATIRRPAVPSICPTRSIPTTCRSTAIGKSQPENVRLPEARAKAARRVSRHDVGRRSRRQPQGPRSSWPNTPRAATSCTCATRSTCSATEFTAEHFRTRVERFFAAGPDGWPCWSFLQPRRAAAT